MDNEAYRAIMVIAKRSLDSWSVRYLARYKGWVMVKKLQPYHDPFAVVAISDRRKKRLGRAPYGHRAIVMTFNRERLYYVFSSSDFSDSLFDIAVRNILSSLQLALPIEFKTIVPDLADPNSFVKLEKTLSELGMNLIWWEK